MVLTLLPVVSVELPVWLLCYRVGFLGEPERLVLDVLLLAGAAGCSLLLLDAVLLLGGEVVLAVLHGALVGSQSGVRGCEPWDQVFLWGVQGDGEWGQVERSVWSRVHLPHQELAAVAGGLRRGVRLLVVQRYLVLVLAVDVLGVDGVVPVAAQHPVLLVVLVEHFTFHLVRARRTPAARLEVQLTVVARGVVGDHHLTVIVHLRVAHQDTDDVVVGLLERVQLLAVSAVR